MVADDGWISVTQRKSVMICHRRTFMREFKKRGRGESETRLEVTFRISDEKSMRAEFSTRLDNAT